MASREALVNPFEPTHAVLAWHPAEWDDRRVLYEGSVAACQKHIAHLRAALDRLPVYWRGALVEIRPIEFVDGVYRELLVTAEEPTTGEPLDAP